MERLNMTEPEFFDAGCQAGIKEKGYGESIDILLSEMDRFGVSKALVSDYALNELGAKLSNQRISDLLKKREKKNCTEYGVSCRNNVMNCRARRICLRK